MELPSNLLDEFARITGGQTSPSRNNIAYGVVVKTGVDVYVKLDGTDELTPVSVTMEAEDGDRVRVEINRHTATVVGNITSPASARTATNYMKLTEEGLVVGNLSKAGKPVGTYSLIAPGTYYIVAENGSKLASFSSDNIKLGDGMASFSTDRITLGNGMAVFTTDQISLGNGMATFTTDQITLGNGLGIFSPSEINLGNGKLKIRSDGITFGNGAASFTSTKVTLANGAATFSPDEISLGKGMAVINSSKVSIGNGMATFTTDQIKLSDGMATIGLKEISLANGEAVFASNKITLSKGMAVFTGDSISLGSGMATIGASQISLAKGKAVFSESQISLMNGQATISTDKISLANGKAVFDSNHISLSNGMVDISTNKIKLGDSSNSVIELCNKKGIIQVSNGIMALQGDSAIGLTTSYSSYKSEIVSKCDSATRSAGLQVYDASNNIASVIVSLANGIAMTVPSAKKVTINGYEVLHSYNLMTDGKIIATGAISAGQRLRLSATVTMPSGYYLGGIRQITTNYPKKCSLSGFLTDPSTNKVGTDIINVSDSKISDLRVVIEWFGFRLWDILPAGDKTIDWGAESLD